MPDYEEICRKYDACADLTCDRIAMVQRWMVGHKELGSKVVQDDYEVLSMMLVHTLQDCPGLALLPVTIPSAARALLALQASIHLMGYAQGWMDAKADEVLRSRGGERC